MPDREARALQQLDALKGAGDAAAFLSQTDALLNSSIHRATRLLAASSAGVYTTVTCGIGSLATRYFEQVVLVSQEFAYLEEDFWLTKTGALENLLILATDFETSARWAQRLRDENPRAEVLQTWVERNETRHAEGLSWPDLQVATARGYMTDMQRPGWGAAILEAVLSSPRPRSHREWRLALMTYLECISQVVAGAFNGLSAAGDASSRRANALVDLLLRPGRGLIEAYLQAFPGDTHMEAAAKDFLQHCGDLPRLLAKVVDRKGKSQDEHDPPKGRSGPPVPPVWIQSAPLVRENIALGLAGSRFRLVSVDPDVDRTRAPEPMPCVTLRFVPAGPAPAADDETVHLALRSVVSLSLVYAANRSQACWAATAPVTSHQYVIGLGQGVPAQIAFIGSAPTDGLRARILMWCVSDTVAGGWTVEILPHMLRADQADTLAKVNAGLCKAFRDYLDVELELLGSPVDHGARSQTSPDAASAR
jgi:hypothetical protein